MAYAPNSYYSGPLASINQGRTADAAVAVQDAASQRSFLATLMAERNRQQIAQQDLALRETLGLGELGVRRGDTAVRRELGLGEIDLGQQRIGEMGADRAVRRELGLGTLNEARDRSVLDAQLRREELTQQAKLKTAELEALKLYYQQGGSTDPRVRVEMLRREQELNMLQAEADTAALQANSLVTSELDASTPWYQTRNSVGQSWQDGNQRLSNRVIGNVLTRLGTQAPMVQFDPATRRFIPRSFFSPSSIATPGINPTLPSPVASEIPASGYQDFGMNLSLPANPSGGVRSTRSLFDRFKNPSR